MATQKEVKNRIASIKNINKITRAMEMVAAARLRRAEQRIDDLRPYAEGMRKLTRQAAEQAGGDPARAGDGRARERRSGSGSCWSPATAAWPAPSTPTSSARACGSAAEVRAEGAEPAFSAVGRKGVSALTFRKQEVTGAYIGFTDRPAFANAREIGEELTARYVDEELDRVELVYNRFVSPLTQHVWRQTLLPLQQAEVIGEGADEEEDAERGDRGRESAGAIGVGATSPSPRSCSPG